MIKIFCVVSFVHVVFLFRRKLACKKLAVYYPMYIALTNRCSLFFEKKKHS